MRIVLAPNTFRDSLTAFEAIDAMRAGLRAYLPHAQIIAKPMADGGDGTLSVLQAHFGGSFRQVTVQGPYGTPISSGFQLAADGTTAIIEMAAASGLRLTQEQERDVPHASTFGTGQLIRAALDHRAKRIILGVGGSATIDAGCGALAALGLVFKDTHTNILSPTPAGLQTLACIDRTNLDPRLAETELVLLADVVTTPHECIALYGPQKGLLPHSFPLCHRLFQQLESLTPFPFLHTPGHGAGGAIAGGLAVFAGAKISKGAATIAQLIDLNDALEGAHLVLTGEGSLDISSLEGKAPAVVWEAAGQRGIPVHVLAGRVAPGLQLPKHVTATGISEGIQNHHEALTRAPQLMREATERLARNFRHDPA